jgi:hypothetical protein
VRRGQAFSACACEQRVVVFFPVYLHGTLHGHKLDITRA